MYRIAITGVGAIAETHALAVGNIDGATTVAGACRTESKGRAFAEKFDCRWYENTEIMLDGEDIDVLSICTPSGAHLEPALSAANRSVDVLCEKPLEITTERIDQMMAAAENAGVHLGGIFPQRYNPVIRTVHEAISAGRFSDLSTINIYVPWWRDDEYYGPNRWQGTAELDGGGALMNQSIHGVDAIQWLAGADADFDRDENPVEEVFAYTGIRGHDEDRIEVEDTAVVALRYRNGALGQLLGATSMYPGSLKRLQIGGRDGTAEILEDELTTWQFRDNCDGDKEIRDRFTETKTGGGAADPMDIDYSLHTRNIEAFLSSVSADEPFMLDAIEARKAVEIIEAVYESAGSGQSVTIG